VCLADSLIARNQALGGAGAPDGAAVGGGVYIASGTVGIQNALYRRELRLDHRQ
jgi:hypothetical protein